MNLVDYVVALMIGAELLDEKIAISFAKMIHRKIRDQETGTILPLPAEK